MSGSISLEEAPSQGWPKVITDSYRLCNASDGRNCEIHCGIEYPAHDHLSDQQEIKKEAVGDQHRSTAAQTSQPQDRNLSEKL